MALVLPADSIMRLRTRMDSSIPKGQDCEYGMTMGLCFDEYPPFRIWKARHEVHLPKENSHIYLCSDCLNFYYIDDEDKVQDDDYDLTHIDKEALEKWNSEASKRLEKRAEYLEKEGRIKIEN